MFNHINNVQNNRDRVEECREMLRALSDETREQIIQLIVKRKEVNVSDIAANFSLSRPTISHHLNVMKRAKLLNARKEGKEVFYSFNKAYVIELLGWFVDNLRTCC